MTNQGSMQPVTNLQTMLWTLSRVSTAMPPVVPDGVYGEQTRRAVTEFQRQHGMETTGIADYETWEGIREEYQNARVQTEPAVPLQICMDCGQVFLPGCRNCHVHLVQAMLCALSESYRELRDVRVTGIYDEQTQKAVSWLQGHCGKTCSGIFNKEDWKLLCGLYQTKTGNGEKDLKP